MGDMGDIFNADKEYRKARSRTKKLSNLEQSTAMLDDLGIHYESKNNGVHLVVDCCFDYWPSTGLFIHRQTKAKGRGVRNLLKALEATND